MKVIHVFSKKCLCANFELDLNRETWSRCDDKAIID